MLACGSDSNTKGCTSGTTSTCPSIAGAEQKRPRKEKSPIQKIRLPILVIKNSRYGRIQRVIYLNMTSNSVSLALRDIAYRSNERRKLQFEAKSPTSTTASLESTGVVAMQMSLHRTLKTVCALNKLRMIPLAGFVPKHRRSYITSIVSHTNRYATSPCLVTRQQNCPQCARHT